MLVDRGVRRNTLRTAAVVSVLGLACTAASCSATENGSSSAPYNTSSSPSRAAQAETLIQNKALSLASTAIAHLRNGDAFMVPDFDTKADSTTKVEVDLGCTGPTYDYSAVYVFKTPVDPTTNGKKAVMIQLQRGDFVDVTVEERRVKGDFFASLIGSVQLSSPGDDRANISDRNNWVISVYEKSGAAAIDTNIATGDPVTEADAAIKGGPAIDSYNGQLLTVAGLDQYFPYAAGNCLVAAAQ